MPLTAEQLQARKRGLGGSDAAAVLGLSPWASPLDVYLEKADPETPPTVETEAMYWGNVLEDVITREFAKRTGLKVRRSNVTHRLDGTPLIAHVDRLIEGAVDGHRALLEAKASSIWNRDEWGDEGTDQIPKYYLIQVQHYMAVLGFQLAFVAVLLGGNDFRIYRVPANQKLIGDLVHLERRFWERHVERRIPPDPQSLADLYKLWPHDDGHTVTVAGDSPAFQAAQQLAVLKAIKSGLKEPMDKAEETIKAEMGSGATLLGPGGETLATWKSYTSQRLDSKRLKADEPDLAKKYTLSTEARRFTLKVKPKKPADIIVQGMPTAHDPNKEDQNDDQQTQQ